MIHPTALYMSACAGSPSPIDESEAFDLAAHLITHPYDTFYVRVSGDSMINAGIFDGDILVVDRAIEPRTSDIVVAQTGEGFTVKRFKNNHGMLRLVPENPNYSPIEVDQNARICGVAKFTIHRL